MAIVPQKDKRKDEIEKMREELSERNQELAKLRNNYQPPYAPSVPTYYPQSTPSYPYSRPGLGRFARRSLPTIRLRHIMVAAGTIGAIVGSVGENAMYGYVRGDSTAAIVGGCIGFGLGFFMPFILYKMFKDV